MSTITAILQPETDGTIHLPVPKKLRQAKFKVVATVQRKLSAEEAERAEKKRQREILRLLKQLQASNPFKGIDAAEYQREIREDGKSAWDELYGEPDDSTPR